MRQLHLRDTLEPRHHHELSAKEKVEVLESHLFLKLKRGRNIKGQAVADGNKQRDFISKEGPSSPTIATKAVLLSFVFDAQEHRDIATIDIPNVFIQTSVNKIEEMETIIVQGTLVDVIVEITPEIYGLYVSTDKKGVKTLILRCHNAIYGTMLARLLCYRKFCKTINHLGFKINLYDPCFANRTIEDNQQTICWNVD